MEITSSFALYSSDKPFLLEKRIALLKAIVSEGSMLKAAKKVPISYKAAWEAIDEMNNLCHTPLVTKETGGKGGGGTSLTAYGKKLIRTYELLKAEQERFLEHLSTMADFSTGDLNTLQRIAMQLSARNQLSGTIESITLGKVAAEIDLKLKSGNIVVSSITKNGAETLGLTKGMDIVAIFKATSVMLANDESLKISAKNQLRGTIESVTHGEVSCEVVVDIGGGEKIVSVVTDGSCKNLHLEPGSKVTAIIKATEIMVGR